MPTHECLVEVPEQDYGEIITLLGRVLTQARERFNCPFCRVKSYTRKYRRRTHAQRSESQDHWETQPADRSGEWEVATAWTPWEGHKPDCAARHAYYLRERLVHPEVLAALDPMPPF